MPLINIRRLDFDIASDYKLLLLPLKKKIRPKSYSSLHRANRIRLFEFICTTADIFSFYS